MKDEVNFFNGRGPPKFSKGRRPQFVKLKTTKIGCYRKLPYAIKQLKVYPDMVKTIEMLTQLVKSSTQLSSSLFQIHILMRLMLPKFVANSKLIIFITRLGRVW